MKRLFLLLMWLTALPIGMLAQGTTWQSATFIKSGSSVSYSLDDKNTEVYYKIDVPEEGSVKITMTCSGDLTMNWVDIYWKRGENDYSSRVGTGWYPESGKSFEMTDAGKGVYYVRGQRYGGKGTLTLSYEFTPCPYTNDAADNDASGSGTQLEDGKVVQGRLGYKDATDYRDNNDWYKIEVPQDGRIDIIYELDQTYELALNWMDIRWYRGIDDYPSREGSGWYPPASGTVTLTDAGKGTYYIQMQRYGGHGGYKLKYVFTPNNYTNDPEPNDDNGQGAEIANGQTVQGHLGYLDGTDYRDKNDWWRIEVPQDGRIDLIYQCDQTYELALNWMDIRWKRGDDDYPSRVGTGWYPEPSGTLTCEDAGKGTYYIQIQRNSGHGGYSLKYVFTPNNYRNDTEPNNEINEVTQVIGIDSRVTGHLGYLDGADNRDNNDWFKLDTKNAASMLVVTIETDNKSTLKYNWVDIKRQKGDDVRTVAGSGWYPEGSTITLTASEIDRDANYYVHLQRYTGHGGYTLTYGHAAEINVATIVNFLTGNTAGISKEEVDINGDGVVNIADIILLINIILSN